MMKMAKLRERNREIQPQEVSQLFILPLLQVTRPACPNPKILNQLRKFHLPAAPSKNI